MRDLTGEAGAAWAALEVRFNPNHGVGGQFATAPGSGSKGENPKQKQQLLERAAADRKRIRSLRDQLKQLEQQMKSHPHQAAKVTKQSVNAAKSAAAKKAAATKATHSGGGQQQGKGAQQASRKPGHTPQTLQQQADHIKQQISNLTAQVKELDAKAANL